MNVQSPHVGFTTSKHVIDPKGGIDEQSNLPSGCNRAKRKFTQLCLYIKDFCRYCPNLHRDAVLYYVNFDCQIYLFNQTDIYVEQNRALQGGGGFLPAVLDAW